MIDDDQLLRRYAEEGSEKAFGELVGRYLDLVYCTAIRRVGGDSQLAQDVAQIVFSALARKARLLPKDVVLGGWLYRHTCLVAAQTVRTERRRRVREQEAMAMKSMHTEPEPSWEHLEPYLDEAMRRLGERDRDAIVLRYFERRDLRGVSQAMSTTEEAARKRVSRAVEKLRAYFQLRGLTLSAGTLAGLLAGHAVTAAPAGLAANITSAALVGAATAGAGIAQLLTEILAASKAKAGLVSALCVASLATPPGFQYQSEARAQWTPLNEATGSKAQLSNPPIKTLPYYTLLPTLGAALSGWRAWSDDLMETVERGETSSGLSVASAQATGFTGGQPSLSGDEISRLALLRPRPPKYSPQGSPALTVAPVNPAAKSDPTATGEHKPSGSTASDVSDLAAQKPSVSQPVPPPDSPMAAPDSKPVDVVPAAAPAAAAPIARQSSAPSLGTSTLDLMAVGTGGWFNVNPDIHLFTGSSNLITNGFTNGTIFVFDPSPTGGNWATNGIKSSTNQTTYSGSGMTVTLFTGGVDWFPVEPSTLQISRLAGSQTGNLITLSWLGGPGIRLQTAAMAARPNWHEVPDTDGRSSVTLPDAEPNAIFRLIHL